MIPIPSLEEAVARALLLSDRPNSTWSRGASSAKWWLLAQAALTAIQEAGYAVVPVVPTEAMIKEGRSQASYCTDGFNERAPCIAEHMWSAMIQASSLVGGLGSVGISPSEKPSPTLERDSEAGEGA